MTKESEILGVDFGEFHEMFEQSNFKRLIPVDRNGYAYRAARLHIYMMASFDSFQLPAFLFE